LYQDPLTMETTTETDLRKLKECVEEFNKELNKPHNYVKLMGGKAHFHWITKTGLRSLGSNQYHGRYNHKSKEDELKGKSQAGVFAHVSCLISCKVTSKGIEVTKSQVELESFGRYGRDKLGKELDYFSDCMLKKYKNKLGAYLRDKKLSKEADALVPLPPINNNGKQRQDLVQMEEFLKNQTGFDDDFGEPPVTEKDKLLEEITTTTTTTTQPEKEEVEVSLDDTGGSHDNDNDSSNKTTCEKTIGEEGDAKDDNILKNATTTTTTTTTDPCKTNNNPKSEETNKDEESSKEETHQTEQQQH